MGTTASGVNGILNSVKQKEISNIDVQIYDLKQAFDSLWIHDVMNDMFEVSEPDDKLSLLFEANKESLVAINTPLGLTERKLVKMAEMQGSVWAPLKCAVTMDVIGKETETIEENHKNLIKYKNIVAIPPLEMIDDLLTFAECGQKSKKMNTYINAKIELKKLELSDKKCKKMHLGSDNFLFPDLFAHNKDMSSSDLEKYLGDLISSDCSNVANLSAKSAKGMGKISQIMNILNEVSLGVHYFEIAVRLREALFVNSIMTNVEALYGLTKENIEILEDVDKVLLRKIFSSHSKCPSEAFYLELGILPISYIIKGRRLMFLHDILKRKENELLSRFFHAQNLKPIRNDWCTTVKEDLKFLNINLSFDEIKVMSKYSFKKIVKTKIRECAFYELMSKIEKNDHSKLKNILYQDLKMQPYLNSNLVNSNQAKQLFRFRTRMSNVKSNFKSMYSKVGLQCPLPECLEIEDDKHLLECEITNRLRNDTSVEFKKLYTGNVKEQLIIIDLLVSAEKIRDTMLEDDIQNA